MDHEYWQNRVAVITGATHGIGLRRVNTLIETSYSKLTCIDFLINNIGINGGGGSVL